MDLVDYLRILRKRWVLVVLTAVLGVGAGMGMSAATSPLYRADTLLFISMHDANTALMMQGGLFTTQRVQSYTEVLDSPMVLQPVVDELDLKTTARELSGRVGADAPLGTVVLEVTVEDRDAEQAARIADSTAKHFARAIKKLERPSPDVASLVRVSVLRPAEVPTVALEPRTSRNLALGLLAGLVAGAGIAVLREVLDTTVRAPETLTELGAPALGTTMLAGAVGQRPQLMGEHVRTPQSEAMRQIRTNLQFVDVDHPPQVVVLTSPLPRDGKSTTAANLALTMATAGIRTILVEGDLRLPKVAEYLGVESSAGLTTVLAGQADIDDVLQPYGDTGLSVLASGPIPSNPAALLGSRHMADLVARLRERADLVIIDSPPLLPVTDAAVIARHADGVVLVVRYGRTTRDQAVKALERLHAVDGKVLGGILTMAPVRGTEQGYGYGYTYGYGYQPEIPVEPVLTSR